MRYKLRYPQLWDQCVGAWTPSQENGITRRATDFSGRNNTGTMSADWEPSIDMAASNGGVAWSFNGESPPITVSHHDSLMPTSALTLSMWVRPASTTNGGLLMKGPLTSSQGVYQLTVATLAAGWYFRLNGSTSEGNGQESGGSPQIGVWQHVCGVWDGAMMALYVDRKLIGSSAYSTALSADTNALNIGVYYTTSHPFLGLLDDVRIYCRGISFDELNLLGSRRAVAYEMARTRPPHRVAGPAFKAYCAAQRSQIIGGGVR